MNEWFESQWAGIAQVFRLCRQVSTKDKTREEIVYGFTNLPRKKANAQRLSLLEQEHWAVENTLHYRRDVSLGEDACQVRVAGAPPALAALNAGVLALMDWLHVHNVASQMRRFCARPHEAVQLLCGAFIREDGTFQKPCSPARTLLSAPYRHGRVEGTLTCATEDSPGSGGHGGKQTGAKSSSRRADDRIALQWSKESS